MKNLKPSQLPVRTVIGTKAPHYESLYIKGEDGIWEDLFSGCGCCQDNERISDQGCKSTFDDHSLRLTTTKTSDEYFMDFKVIAADPEVVWDGEALHGPWIDDYLTFVDGTSIHMCKGYNCED